MRQGVTPAGSYVDMYHSPVASSLRALAGVIAASAALMIGNASYAQMVLSFVLFGLVFGAALPLRAIVMSEWTAVEVYGAIMGVQAALIALGRAAIPALTGTLHDLDHDYGTAMVALTGLLAGAAVLIYDLNRRS